MNIEQIVVFVRQNTAIVWFYLPLGIIGVWRWGVWLFRRAVANYYLPPKGNYRGTLSVVTPVYNEDAKLFRRALDSWKDNQADEIIAVIDYSDEKNIGVFQNFAETFPGANLIVTKKPGKRPALADGVRVAKSEIVALVDSDTVWSPNIKNKLTGPFADPRVGGVVTRQDVFETDTLARKLFKILLDDRYLLEYPFLATVSDALLCLSGRTAVYRKKAISSNLNELVSETFMGKPMISGDDKTLTRLIHKDGWKSRYVRDARVYTSGTADMRGFLKQKIRWTRNGLRSDSKVIFSTWVWKWHKMLAFHMLDKFISPLTLLLSPIYLAVAIFLGHWKIAFVIVLWWMISRTIKIFPHLREKPADVFILPWYIAASFFMAVVKLYAFITIDEQGWMTRWDKSRIIRLGVINRAVSFAATGMVIFGMFFLVFNYKNDILIAAQQQKRIAQEAKKQEQIQKQNIFTPEMARPNEKELENIKTDLVGKNKGDPYGYYTVKLGDTVSGLRRRFNLSASGEVLNAKTKTPLGILSPLVAGQQVAISVNDLRNSLDANTLATSLSFAKPPRVTYEVASNTIFVAQGGSLATLTKISQALFLSGRGNLLQQTAPGEWILRANLYIGKGVTFVLDGAEARYLKLKSDDLGFVWVRSQTGNILISNTKITSWDEKNNSPDIDYEKGRAYITAKASGRMDIINSELAYLGYEGLPKRGGPFGGSYGVSWKITSQDFRGSLLTGVVLNSKFHHNYFGFYTFGVSGMLVKNNEAYENIQYGFDPHDDSNNMLIENNRAYRNGNHGIIISRRCFNNSIVSNESFNNRLHGIMIDRDSNNNLVQGNILYGNVDGVVIYGSNGNLVLQNDVKHNIKGLRINAGSANNYAEGNLFSENSRGVYIYGGARKNIVVKNQIKNNDIGITLKGASENIFLDNFSKLDNKKDGRVTTDAYENNIQ
jgi:parallel beta-helix repeat protein